VGLILDTSVLVDAERRRLNVARLLDQLSQYEAENISICAVTVMELAQGIAGAKTEEVKQLRERFLRNLRASVPVIALSDALALRAGRLNGSLRQSGITIGIADAMIAASALDSGSAVATFNVRHFKAVLGLEVVEL
jgi:predicted nucleic acid-binding protein